MTASSFQPLNPRQLDLQRRLLVAHDLRKTTLVAQLELQWVHRYGLTSLPKHTANPAERSVTHTLSSEAEPSLEVLDDFSDQATETKSSQVTDLLGDSLKDVGDIVEATADRCDQPLTITPPPMAPGPQRFRRWLIATSEDHYLQAS